MWRWNACRSGFAGAFQEWSRGYGVARFVGWSGACADDACRRGRRIAQSREGGVRYLNVLSLLGVGVLLAFSFYLLSTLGAKSAPLYLALGAVFLFALASEPYFRAVEALFTIPTNAQTSEVAKTVSKALALGYLVGMGADLCDSLGANALSKALVFGGRMLIFSLGLPYLTSLISMAREWLSL